MEINQAAPKFQDVSIAPMHTAEHLLNATMVKTFGCPRSRNAHIERKKSKCDYILNRKWFRESCLYCFLTTYFCNIIFRNFHWKVTDKLL